MLTDGEPGFRNRSFCLAPPGTFAWLASGRFWKLVFAPSGPAPPTPAEKGQWRTNAGFPAVKFLYKIVAGPSWLFALKSFPRRAPPALLAISLVRSPFFGSSNYLLEVCVVRTSCIVAGSLGIRLSDRERHPVQTALSLRSSACLCVRHLAHDAKADTMHLPHQAALRKGRGSYAASFALADSRAPLAPLVVDTASKNRHAIRKRLRGKAPPVRDLPAELHGRLLPAFLNNAVSSLSEVASQ